MSKLEIELRALLLGEKVSIDICNGTTGEIIIPANNKIKAWMIRKLIRVVDQGEKIEIDPSPFRDAIKRVFLRHKGTEQVAKIFDRELTMAFAGVF